MDLPSSWQPSGWSARALPSHCCSEHSFPAPSESWWEDQCVQISLVLSELERFLYHLSSSPFWWKRTYSPYFDYSSIMHTHTYPYRDSILANQECYTDQILYFKCNKDFPFKESWRVSIFKAKKTFMVWLTS